MKSVGGTSTFTEELEMGRKKLTTPLAADRRATYTLTAYPAWLCYEDCQHLLRLYQGKGFGKAAWIRLINEGRIPAHRDPFGTSMRFKWVSRRSRR